MNPIVTRLVLGLVVATAGAGIASAQQAIRESPFSDLNNGPPLAIDMHAPFNDRFKTYMHNDSVAIKRSRFGMHMAEGSMTAAAAGPPVMRVAPDKSADQTFLIAELTRKAYFPDQSQRQVFEYVVDRMRDYDRAAKAEDMPSLNVGSSCTYLVESMYDVGMQVRVDPRQRRNVRVGCIVAFAGAEARGKFPTNASRLAVTEFMAASGATFRDLYAKAAAAGDTVQRDKIAGEARTTFKQFFGVDFGRYTPERFPCYLAGPGESCDTILEKGEPQFDQLIALSS